MLTERALVNRLDVYARPPPPQQQQRQHYLEDYTATEGLPAVDTLGSTTTVGAGSRISSGRFTATWLVFEGHRSPAEPIDTQPDPALSRNTCHRDLRGTGSSCSLQSAYQMMYSHAVLVNLSRNHDC
jgi:hypothetical protein